jgi:hypothetical protein
MRRASVSVSNLELRFGISDRGSVSDFGANIRHIGAPYPISELTSAVSELRTNGRAPRRRDSGLRRGLAVVDVCQAFEPGGRAGVSKLKVLAANWRLKKIAMQHNPLTLTSKVYDRRLDVSLAEIEGVLFEAGDVGVYENTDYMGRMAIAGGHTNYGYSGYFRASIYDGKKWRNFKIWDFVSGPDRTFQTRRDMPEVRKRLVEIISEKRGNRVTWVDRSYALDNERDKA